MDHVPEAPEFLSFSNVDNDVRRKETRLEHSWRGTRMTIAPEQDMRQRPHGSAWVDDWAPLGACSKSDPDALFVQGAAQQTAKVVCQRCPVIAECLADALDNRTEFGVWGGMTERERRQLLRQRSDVADWSVVLLGKHGAVHEH
jgi:WhiB family redox-sensing transcriptional regulator